MRKDRLLIVIIFIFFLTACQKETDEEMRIISLIPSNTEIIAELGLLENLVMVTTTDDYPETVKSKEFKKVDTFNFQIEALIAEKPTHIVTHESNTMVNETLDQVAEATDAKILVIENAETVEDVFRDIEKVGVFLSKEQEALTLVKKLKKDFETVKDKAQQREAIQTVVLLSLPPEIYTIGNKTFIGNILEAVHLINVFEDLSGYPVVSNEEIVKRNPEHVINLTGVNKTTFYHSIEQTPGLKSLDIAQEENQCNPDVNLVSRPGPRIIEGMNALLECGNQ